MTISVMSKSSEEVLLIVSHVRHKKVDGTMYLMGERMAWMQENKQTFGISHSYIDIKVQKISPDGKDKVQLQVLMHSGSANTFHFNNPQGREAQLKDRDAIKELLQQLLPKFRRKVSSELEEKNRLLQKDPRLLQLYKDLVVSQVVTAEEFWAGRVDKFSSGNKNDKKQLVGVSAAFLADIKPQTDGCNGLKYNLTADIIESIFKTYPMVKKKYADYIPHKMSESEFWTKFFQSHYFHRDRITAGNKDLFSECAKNDDEEIRQEVSRSINDPFLDLTQITDNYFEEGYGNMGEDLRSGISSANAQMIRRFNHHSTMVLKTCEQKQQSEAEQSPMTNCKAAGSSQMDGNNKNSSNAAELSQPACKKARIRERIQYDDLKSEKNNVATSLKLTKMERYLHGPTPLTAAHYTNSDDIVQAAATTTHEIQAWEPSLPQVLPESLALNVLSELSPGGMLMSGTSQQELQQMVPTDLREELRQLYNALCELLRHYWFCFPTSSKFLEEKVVKMKATLERFHVAKLKPMKDQLLGQHYSVNLTGHMEELLKAAYTKFDNWQAKRLSKK